MIKPGRFGHVPLGNICGKCHLDDPNIVVEPSCTSGRQLWSVFWCIDCKKRGLVNVSIQNNVLEIYKWNPNAPAARHWMRDYLGMDK